MVLIHPRRFRRLLRNWLFYLACRRQGVGVSIGNNCNLNQCKIKGSNNCEIVIEGSCSINYCNFHFYGEGGRIIIREGTVINSSKRVRTNMFVRGKTYIDIGKNCLIAHSVDISTTDFHTVLNSDGVKTNSDSSVAVGDHVWIGKRVTITKGVVIPSESIVGASSVVTKQFFSPNVVIAGNPAVVKKQGITWCR